MSAGWTRCSVTCDPAPGQLVRFGIGPGSNGEARIDNVSLVQWAARRAVSV